MLMLEFSTEEEAIEASNKVFVDRKASGIVDMCCGSEVKIQITTKWGTPVQIGDKWYVAFPDFTYDIKPWTQVEKDFPESVEESKEHSLEPIQVGE
jgi:hypothetical protein